MRDKKNPISPKPPPMTEPRPPEDRQKEIEILNRAFAAFNEATDQLQSSYDNLQERVKRLDLELAKKNEALQKNLQEKEEVKNYLNDILESLTNGVIVVDKRGAITTFNKTAGTITGLNPEACLGRSLNAVFDTDLFENLVARLTKNQGQPLSVDREWRAGDGRRVDLRVSASPVLDNQGGQIGAVLVAQDMSRLRRLEEEAQRNQRLRAMGEMAAGIAHEIRNPLGSIELFASLLKKDVAGDSEKEDLVEHIRSGVKNMDRIISSLLLFAQSPRPCRQKCDINRLLSELLEESPDLNIPGNIKVERKFSSERLWASGDKELLRQVFINLFRNGVQALDGEAGELRLRTEKGTPAANRAASKKDHREFITVTIADTGPGIPSEHLLKVFNPFYSTKDKGTGLGLAISHNIIKAHHGTIDAESGVGRETRFIVKIPCWDQEVDEK